MLPENPSESVVHITKRYMEDEALPTAIDQIVKLSTHPKPEIALSASKWIAEQVLGKPKQVVEETGTMAEIAKTLAQTFRQLAENQSAGVLPSNQPEIELQPNEHGVYILGDEPEAHVSEAMSEKQTTSSDGGIRDDSFPG